MREGRDVDLHHLQLPLQRQFGEPALSAESGVVDEHVHFEPGVLEMPKDVGKSLRLSQIGDQHPRIHLMGLAEFVGQRFEGTAASRHQHQSAAVGSEALGQFLADARGRASDENRFRRHMLRALRTEQLGELLARFGMNRIAVGDRERLELQLQELLG